MSTKRTKKHNFTPPHNRVGRRQQTERGLMSSTDRKEPEESEDLSWWDDWLAWRNERRARDDMYGNYYYSFPTQEEVLEGVTKAIQDAENQNVSP